MDFNHKNRACAAGPILSNLLFLISALPATAALAEPGNVDRAMYFRSQVQDAPECRLRVNGDGRLVFPDSISSPAATCPDAFAWKRYLETILAEFWRNWAYDSFTWPTSPLPLCSDGQTAGSCCDPASMDNPGYSGKNPGKNCPYFPGDHIRKSTTHRSPAATLQLGHGTFVNTLDPGRVIRQEMAEIVFRNRPMWAYVFKHDLYNRDGLGARFRTAVKSVQENSPYRAAGVEVRFPADSIMFKTDWLHQKDALKMGMIKKTGKNGERLNPPQNPDFPFITMNITASTPDNDAKRFRPGLHYLVAVTAASKDLPNWHWYAMEHVANRGRCDYIGCNDSFGYASKTAPRGYLRNYIPPMTQSDGLVSPSQIFQTGKTYPSATITPALKAIYETLGIGAKDDGNPNAPSAGDAGWRSYRLKGTQTQFTSSDGVPTVLGQSITEGGFVNTASCLTCHAQATVDARGQPAIQSFGFSRNLNLFGYNKSAGGAPEAAWFYNAGTNIYQALPTDFTWGVLFAQPLQPPVKRPSP